MTPPPDESKPCWLLLCTVQPLQESIHVSSRCRICIYPNSNKRQKSLKYDTMAIIDDLRLLWELPTSLADDLPHAWNGDIRQPLFTFSLGGNIYGFFFTSILQNFECAIVRTEFRCTLYSEMECFLTLSYVLSLPLFGHFSRCVCVCVCVCLGTGIHGIASRWYGTPLVLCGCFPKEQPRGRTTNDDDLFLFVRIRCGGPILDFFTHVFYPDLGHNKHCLSVHHGDDSDPCLLSNVGR